MSAEIEIKAPPGTVMNVARLSDISPMRIEWLWPGRFALGKLSIIGGDPGTGKSLVTVAIAAAVTRGARWPVERTRAPLGDVLFLSAEDDIADTILPRFIAAGADTTRVHCIQSVTEYDPETGERRSRQLMLAKDLERIDQQLQALPGCKLLVIDPISAYMSGADTHKDAEVRGLLAPLAELASRHKIAVLGVMHLNKGNGNAMYRMIGSIAFVAAARAAYAVVKDPDDSCRRFLMPLKNNLGQDHTGLAYKVDEAENGAPVVTWEPDPIEADLNELFESPKAGRPPEERAKAEGWLTEQLSHGPRRTSDLKEAAENAGIAWRTVERAKTSIGVIAKREQFGRKWVWCLPDSPPVPCNRTCGGVTETDSPWINNQLRRVTPTVRHNSGTGEECGELPVDALLVEATRRAKAEGIDAATLRQHLSPDDLADPELMNLPWLIDYAHTIARKDGGHDAK